jgi:hypothetical protein
MSTATTFPEPAPPPEIHSCPSCSHWLADGTLACPDCNTLTYGLYLRELAGSAQQFEQQGKWAEARERWRATLKWLPENAEQAAGIQQHIEQINGRLKAEEDRKAKWTKRLGPFAPIALFWALFGWKFALGFTGIIFVHEMGHFVSVKRRGLKADLPLFFPGLGAYVRWYSMGISVDQLAAIALAGPMYGLAAALGCLAVAWGTHGNFRDLFLVLANDEPEKPHTATMVYFLGLILALGFLLILTPVPVGGRVLR